MNQPATYTPLESLFLFQSLLAHGVDTAAFARTSELLKGNALIKSDDSYNPTRLSPDALQQLFLLLLRDELKSEAERIEDANASGNDAPGSPGSKKRKLASPPLPSLADALEHIEKVPALVDRLYARYRDHVVKQVREDERRFEAVQKEIQLLERSERERLAKAASQNGTPTLAPRDARNVPGIAVGQPGGPGNAGLISTTPVHPPRPPFSSTSQPGASSPAMTVPSSIRPALSTKPKSPAPVLQAPAGARPPPGGVLQAPGQPPKPSISPRPPGIPKGNDPTSGVATQTPGGSLKWETPYQPSKASPSQASGPFQPPPQNASAGPQAGQLPLQSQKLQQQKNQPVSPVPISTSQNRTSTSSVLVPPHNAGTLGSLPGQPDLHTKAPPQPRPSPGKSTASPGRPIQSQQHQSSGQPGQRPLAATPSLSKPPTGLGIQVQKGAPAPTPAAKQQTPPATLISTPVKDKQLPSSLGQYPRPPIPEHMIRQAVNTPNQAKRINHPPSLPQTPQPASPASLTRGFGTKWASHSTPSTPGPIAAEPESPAYEPVSPPQRSVAVASDVSKSISKKPTSKAAQKLEVAIPKPGRGRPPRSGQKAKGLVTTPSATGTRRSQSVTSQTDELSIDYSVPSRIKNEESTPRPNDDAGDTTADESVQGRTHMATPGSVSSRLTKRKRQDTPVEPPAPQTHVLWTRGFTKVSSSALDQISSHRDANMFATALRERDAPNYRQIVLQPQDITSIRSAIKQGNKAAVQAAASLASGDPGTASVWLPVSEDLVPPKGIINSAHLERELVHMFCNAIMYNPDPDRGLGPAFVKRDEDEEDEVIGYLVDENGVVKNTRSMFLEVEKLLGDLRSAEKQRGAPPFPGSTRPASVATPADDTAEDEDELAGDGEVTSGTAKRRRISTRG